MAATLSSSFISCSQTSFFGTSVTTKPNQTQTVSFNGPLQVFAKKAIRGTVVGNKRDKTVSVEVKRMAMHPLYKKRIVTSKVYHAHDPENECKEGDIVVLVKCAPVSKTKKFLVSTIQSKTRRAPTEVVLPPLESEVASA